jgi:hypothetical protein
MLVWDPVSERNLPFGTLKTAALGWHILIFGSRTKPSVQTNPGRITTRDHAVSELSF